MAKELDVDVYIRPRESIFSSISRAFVKSNSFFIQRLGLVDPIAFNADLSYLSQDNRIMGRVSQQLQQVFHCFTIILKLPVDISTTKPSFSVVLTDVDGPCIAITCLL